MKVKYRNELNIINLLQSICDKFDNNSYNSVFQNIYDETNFKQNQYKIHKLKQYFTEETNKIESNQEYIFNICEYLDELIKNIDFSKEIKSINDNIEFFKTFEEPLTISFESQLKEYNDTFYSSAYSLNENINEESVKQTIFSLFKLRNQINQNLKQEYSNQILRLDNYINNISAALQNILMLLNFHTEITILLSLIHNYFSVES